MYSVGCEGGCKEGVSSASASALSLDICAHRDAHVNAPSRVADLRVS